MQKDSDNSRPSSKRRNKPQEQQTQESRAIDRSGSNRYQNGDYDPARVLASHRATLERLASVAKHLESFVPEISIIETEFEEEIDREKEIQRLSHTVETLMSSKSEELERLRKENASLKADQEACVQEKEKCQTIQAELRSRSDETDARRKQEYETKLQKSQKQIDVKKAELEAELKGKARDAEKESKKLSDQNDDLKESLKEVKAEMKAELRKDSLALQQLDDKNASLAKELEQVKNEFPVEGKPVEYYLQNFKSISSDIQATSTRYFQKLPEQYTDAVYEALRQKHPIFNSVSLLDTDSADFIRVAMAQYIMASSLCDHIWQPFLTETSDSRHINQFLSEVSQCLAASKGHGESAWRALTLRGIDAMAISSKQRQADIALEQVSGVLDPLISIEELDRFKADLTSLIHKSISTWEVARKDEYRIHIRRQPDPNDKTNWHPAANDDSTLPAAETTLTPLCLFPQVSQTRSEGKEVLIHQGSALFPSSSVWIQAMLEKKEQDEEAERLMQEARSKANMRRVSVPASPAGIAGGTSGFMSLNKYEFR